MKAITRYFLLFVAAALMSSCEGEQGPPGYDGLDGLNGEALLGTVFEIQGTFGPKNDYLLYYQFPSDFEIYDGDVVMAYILWEQVDGTNGNVLDVWRPLPQTIVLNEGILQYNFDYTLSDVQVFIDGSIDFNSLLPAETDNQIFRIAVIPADLVTNKSINIEDLNSVMKALEFNTKSIDKIQLIK